MRHFITQISRQLSRLPQILLPNLCQICHHNSHDLVCKACYVNWLMLQQPRCARCAHKLEFTYSLSLSEKNTSPLSTCGTCLSHPPAFIRTFTLGDYAAPQDQLIWAFKFGRKLPLAYFFAQHLAQLVKQSLTKMPYYPSLLVPIPLSKRRLAQRGYNQIWEITRRLSRLCHIPTRPDVLVKTRETFIQTSLDIMQRQRNLRGSLTVNFCVKGLHIALIDDVMTSGVTLNEAARTLIRAGASSVSNYVLLRTPRL